MKVARRLLRESSYGRSYVSQNQIDYGGVYHLQYTDETNDKDTKYYFVFVIQPNVDGKTHCLDLDLIEEDAFDAFFRKVRLEDDVKVQERKRNRKGYVKDNIRIGNKFYDSFIKSNEDLVRHKPYKTLLFKNINNVRYIAYDVE